MEASKAMDLIPECYICSCKYDLDKRLPLALGCVHTFCKVCMLEMYNRNWPAIICPVCMKRFEYSSQQDIAKNFMLID